MKFAKHLTPENYSFGVFELPQVAFFSARRTSHLLNPLNPLDSLLPLNPLKSRNPLNPCNLLDPFNGSARSTQSTQTTQSAQSTRSTRSAQSTQPSQSTRSAQFAQFAQCADTSQFVSLALNPPKQKTSALAVKIGDYWSVRRVQRRSFIGSNSFANFN